MKNISVAVFLIAAVVPALGRPSARPAPALVAVATLEQRARGRVGAAARVVLGTPSADMLRGADLTELAPAGEVPNYLRALSAIPEAIGPFARLFRTIVDDGRLAPEVKLGMGLRVAQVHGSPYVAAHVQRLLGRTERGRTVLASLRSGDESALPSADALAVRYAELLTRDVHGITDEEFARVRASYDDSEIVELTLTTCFFNYFTRMCEGLALPVEAWAFDPAPVASATAEPRIVPRIGLISDAEMAATAELTAAANAPAAKGSMLGLGVANSMRAMMRSPEAATAWRAYGAAVREKATLERSTQLQISFAVSMANGCRYCTLHQVLGLRKVGVDVGKLVEMKKDDAALTPRELAAVLFARKVTAEPTSTTAADYEGLRREFGERGALEVLLQTCAFAFMNRFTDNLNLPSEDEAVKVYREVYGPSAY